MQTVDFLGGAVELQYPSTRAAIEPVVQAQIELSSIPKEERARRIAQLVDIGAACIAACDPRGQSREHWFGKLYENNHLNGESVLDAELATTAMSMCGLQKAVDSMGKEDPGST